jgi:hypothetical protein
MLEMMLITFILLVFFSVFENQVGYINQGTKWGIKARKGV